MLQKGTLQGSKFSLSKNKTKTHIMLALLLFLHDVAITLEGLWRHTMIYFRRAALGRAQFSIGLVAG